MSFLAENRYGKSRVRVVKVKRNPDRHDFWEWTVEVVLQGEFESCFVDGDNSKILPTDTMKNTVYSLAREFSAECIEDFGKELCVFLLERNPQVSTVGVTISEKNWEHLQTAGRLHPTTFVQSSGECQVTEVTASRNRDVLVRSGLDGLVIMKTAGSEFVGFIKDSLTTLPEATDRLFGTEVSARWKYFTDTLPFRTLRTAVRDTLLDVFARHISKSVQHTLYAMGEAVLANIPEVQDIELAMPNKHCLLVDLARFRQDNQNEIFVPIDEPHGTIQARMQRQG